MKSKKLIIINLLTFTAFILVVGAGIYQAETTKDNFGKNEQEEKNEEQVEATETKKMEIVLKEIPHEKEIEKLESLGGIILQDKNFFVFKEEMEVEEEKEESRTVGLVEEEGEIKSTEFMGKEENNYTKSIVVSRNPVDNSKAEANEKAIKDKEEIRAEEKEKEKEKAETEARKRAEEEARKKANEEAEKKEEAKKKEDKEDEKEEENETGESDESKDQDGEDKPKDQAKE